MATARAERDGCLAAAWSRSQRRRSRVMVTVAGVAGLQAAGEWQVRSEVAVDGSGVGSAGEEG